MLITWNIHKANFVLSCEALLANSISVARTICQQGIDKLQIIDIEGAIS